MKKIGQGSLVISIPVLNRSFLELKRGCLMLSPKATDAVQQSHCYPLCILWSQRWCLTPKLTEEQGRFIWRPIKPAWSVKEASKQAAQLVGLTRPLGGKGMGSELASPEAVWKLFADLKWFIWFTVLPTLLLSASLQATLNNFVKPCETVNLVKLDETFWNLMKPVIT